MFDTNNGCTDDLSVSFAFWGVLSSDLSPKDVGSVEYSEFLGVVNFNFVGNIGTFNNSSMVTVTWLNLIDALVNVRVLVHDLFFIFIFSGLSQIKVSLWLWSTFQTITGSWTKRYSKDPWEKEGKEAQKKDQVGSSRIVLKLLEGRVDCKCFSWNFSLKWFLTFNWLEKLMIWVEIEVYDILWSGWLICWLS